MPHARAVVTQSSVDFQDDATIENEVHATYVRDLHLALERDPEAEQADAEQRLEAALRITAGSIDKPPQPGIDAFADPSPIGAREEPEMPSRLEGGEEHLRGLTVGKLHERTRDRYVPESHDARVTVSHARAALVQMRASLRSDPHVRAGLVQNPDAACAKRADARDGSPVPRSFPHELITVRRAVYTLPETLDSALLKRALKRPPGNPLGPEYASPDQAAMTTDDHTYVHRASLASRNDVGARHVTTEWRASTMAGMGRNGRRARGRRRARVRGRRRHPRRTDCLNVASPDARHSTRTTRPTTGTTQEPEAGSVRRAPGPGPSADPTLTGSPTSPSGGVRVCHLAGPTAETSPHPTHNTTPAPRVRRQGRREPAAAQVVRQRP